jgi:hypothetical protein
MSKTAAQIETQRARWRRAKAAQRARARGQQAPASPRHWRGPATPVLKVPGDWRARGACKGADPRIFDGDTPADVETAKQICAGCPVRADCLRFAIQCGAGYGVWGGVHLGAVVAAAS